jgi:hypothetical protein
MNSITRGLILISITTIVSLYLIPIFGESGPGNGRQRFNKIEQANVKSGLVFQSDELK